MEFAFQDPKFYSCACPHNANSSHCKVHDLLKEWKIHKKILTITLDNARENDNMQDMLRDNLNVHAHLTCGGEFFHVDEVHMC